MRRIQTFLNICLRRLLRIRWPEVIRNEALWQKPQQLLVDKEILMRRWQWIGHALRKPPTSTTRQALSWNPQGKRKRGRPRNTWRRDLERTGRRRASPGTSWNIWPRIATTGGHLLAAYAPGEVEGKERAYTSTLFSKIKTEKCRCTINGLIT